MNSIDPRLLNYLRAIELALRPRGLHVGWTGSSLTGVSRSGKYDIDIII